MKKTVLAPMCTNNRDSIPLRRFLNVSLVTTNTKYFSYTYYCYVRCAKLKVWLGGMPWSKAGATHYHARLGLPNNSCTIKGLFVYNDLFPGV